MADIPTTLATGLVAVLASKDLISKVLGPTAEYLGQETRGLVEKCNINLGNVFNVAYRLITRDKKEEGTVNLRAFKEIIAEGKFAEEPLFQEYYGGLLASAKTPDGKDDRAVYYLSLIKGLSTYQLQLHYLIYLGLCKYCQGSPAVFFNKIKNRSNIEIQVPTSLLRNVVKLEQSIDIEQFILHALMGLSEKYLIGKEPRYVNSHRAERFEGINGSGVVASPTLLGCELFLWGNGLNHLGSTQIGDINWAAVTPIYETAGIVIKIP